jgi:hypothetical protein
MAHSYATDYCTSYRWTRSAQVLRPASTALTSAARCWRQHFASTRRATHACMHSSARCTRITTSAPADVRHFISKPSLASPIACQNAVHVCSYQSQSSEQCERAHQAHCIPRSRRTTATFFIPAGSCSAHHKSACATAVPAGACCANARSTAPAAFASTPSAPCCRRCEHAEHRACKSGSAMSDARGSATLVIANQAALRCKASSCTTQRRTLSVAVLRAGNLPVLNNKCDHLQNIKMVASDRLQAWKTSTNILSFKSLQLYSFGTSIVHWPAADPGT